MTPTQTLIEALRPLTSRVRTDVTAIRVDDGTSRWSGGALTDAALERHITGDGKPRGVCPIRAGESTTSVAVLDLDSHKGATSWSAMGLVAAAIVDVLTLAHGCRPVLFRSGGGRGIHIYCMWDEPQDAYSVRQFMRGVLADVGLKDGAKGVALGQVEVFPKQNEVAADGFGNQFILPFAGKSELLEYEPMSGTYEGAGRVAPQWRFSPPVARVERPAKPESKPLVPSLDGEVPMWRRALDALSNDGGAEDDSRLSYDEWWSVISAIHHETGGSAEGYGIALAWSMRSPLHDTSFLEERIWPYLTADSTRGNTGGTIKSLATKHNGWLEPIVPLGPIPDPDEGTNDAMDPPDRRLMARRHPNDRAAEAAREALTPVERRGIPPAKHLTSDLANANRIVLAYGASILVVGEKWYVWTGKVWRMDEGDVYRFACKLSSLIRAEAKEIRRKAAAGTAFGEGGNETAVEIAKALEKWSAKSEMKGAIEAALGLARKMLTVEASILNADADLLNCRNGIVNLRTGELMPHDPTYFMTHLVDVDYNPDADQSEWQRVVREITREPHGDGVAAPVAEFLQRWFGYCVTGDVSEQAFVVHWGDGANGKSTLIGTIARVLGSYAGVLPPGLITHAGKKTQEHPTGLASLMGLRMGVAHESGEGAVLTDDIVKAITGDDRMKARFMNKDFFEFDPTHKIQLLTNHRPAIRGTDHGIWRRVCLVPYKAVFGSEEEVASGRATALKDKALSKRLSGAPASLQGVLAWLVAGAVEWYERGLAAPDAVLEASAAYRSSQDRVAHFVDECCEIGAEYEEPMAIGTQGLYPAYAGWCKESGSFALARARFAAELERLFPALTFKDVYQRGGSGARRKVRMAHGLRLLD
jgi:P4 family phage/plasmid primase-like protien